MSLDLILISLLGFSIVFVVLILIAIIILATSALLKMFIKEPKKEDLANFAPIIVAPTQISRPPVRLENCDDRTAALVMAIVSNQSKIPLEYLAFKSIKLVEEK